MGIFSIFKKGKKAAPADIGDDELITVEIEATRSQFDMLTAAVQIVEAYDPVKADEETQRILAELEEQQSRRRAALSDLGVPVDLITLDKCRGESFDIAKRLCGLDFEALGAFERDSINWQPPTRTGKVPKCVAIYCIFWDTYKGREHVGCVTCEVSYLADGTPYAAWINDLRNTKTYYKMKMADGELALIAATPA